MDQSTIRDNSFELLLNQLVPLDRPWFAVNRSRQATDLGQFDSGGIFQQRKQRQREYMPEYLETSDHAD